MMSALALSGCLTSNATRIGWTSSVRSNEYTANYTTYDGTTSVPIKIREREVTFTYQARVDKGSLAMRVQDPQGHNLWQTTLKGNGNGSRVLSIPTNDTYVLVVEGQGTGGGFDIHWI
jgi:hypothetical protein